MIVVFYVGVLDWIVVHLSRVVYHKNVYLYSE